MRNEAREHLENAVTSQIAAQADGKTMQKHLRRYFKLARGQRPDTGSGVGTGEDLKRRLGKGI